VFWSGSQPFAAKFPLLPLQVLTDAVRNVIQEFPLLTKKGTFPRGRLWAFVMDFDVADLGTPDRYRRALPPRGIDEVREGMGAAEIFDPSGRLFRVLPRWGNCVQYPPEYHLGSLLAPGKSRRDFIDAPEFFGSFS
jgi:hypothetical protein